ncbi:MAG: methionyl-tRNA formyltransferase [Proteobacteria bacterium]|nr:methionyl-tRNA formyltransferase [Pseudomonadota bacterium]
MNQPKVIFAGTPEFARVSLEALVASGVVPGAILTQPDRPAGRGKRLTPSAVNVYATERGITVMQPTTLRDDAVIADLAALEPDIIIVAAYGLILPQSVLDIPTVGCLNVHASLLPRWRGAAPVQAAILAGDAETGICLMSMSSGLDCGPTYVSETVSIGEQETAGELHDRLAAVGGRLLVAHLADIVRGNISAVEQDESLATYAAKIRTEDAAIDWQRPATELERLVRAYNPAPGAYFMLDDIRIKCWRARQIAAVDEAPGTLVAAGRDGIIVACGDGALNIESLQRPGKRPVTAGEFSTQMDLVGRRL